MTLPAALQARLKKRGLVVKEQKPEEEEEKEEEQLNKKKSYRQQPLPPGWFKVPDSSTNQDYYWNVHTNQVSWRHPNDPRAEITYPASWQKQDEKEDGRHKEETRTLKSKVKVGKHPSLMKAQKQREKSTPYRKSKKDDDKLDPMDPAAYSDVARGTWSTGLREDSEVKTGVDTTANGPLFQQRPYPSPGDILRRNKKPQPKDDEEEEEE